jgi:hypothetical protein
VVASSIPAKFLIGGDGHRQFEQYKKILDSGRARSYQFHIVVVLAIGFSRFFFAEISTSFIPPHCQLLLFPARDKHPAGGLSDGPKET